jgi:hypothetical protein
MMRTCGEVVELCIDVTDWWNGSLLCRLVAQCEIYLIDGVGFGSGFGRTRREDVHSMCEEEGEAKVLDLFAVGSEV